MTAATDEFVAIAQRTQELTTTAVRTWTENAKAYSEQVSIENPLPRPEQVHTAVDAWFDLVAGLLAEQRSLASTVIEAGTEAAGTVTEQARAAAASVPVNPFATVATATDAAPTAPVETATPAEAAKRVRTPRSTTA